MVIEYNSGYVLMTVIIMNSNCVSICAYLFLNSFNGMEIKRIYSRRHWKEIIFFKLLHLNSGDLIILNNLSLKFWVNDLLLYSI